MPQPTPVGVFPASILGLPVHTVSEMHELVAAGKVNGRFIAVGGYWSQVAIPCPFVPHSAPISGFCSGVTFSDSPEPPSSQSIGETSVVAMPETMFGDLLWSSQTQTMPGAVVLIGHSRDSRAWQCLERTYCEGALVIDSVAWVNGTPTVLEPTAREISAVAAQPGEQLVTAIEEDAAHMNDIDPRLLGQPAGSIWYVRMATGSPDSDGISAGLVRALRPGSGETLDELPLAVASDFVPARVILDVGEHSHYQDGHDDQVTVLSPSAVVLQDRLSMETSPLLLQPGPYHLYGWMTNDGGDAIEGIGCTLDITTTAESNVAYFATYTKSSCAWAPGESQF